MANVGTSNAVFGVGQTIVLDNLPNSGISYGTPSVSNVGSGVLGGANISCSVASNDLTCAAIGGAVTLGTGNGSFDVVFTATPTSAVTFTNPRGGGSCTVDTNNNNTESNEVNNGCSNSVAVAKADTTTTITSDDPDPSGTGDAVSVHFTVVPTGSGTPTGNVEVSDGVDNCTGTVAAGSCSISLTTGGARTLTAHYVGDVNFNESTSAGAAHIVDASPPDTTIDSQPSNPSTSGSASFSFSGTDTGTGVASFECQLDGGGFSTCTSPKDYSSLSDASHTFQVRAIDEAGNTDPTPASFTWTIDASGPDTTIGSKPSNPSASGSASFSFSGTDTGTGVASFECQLDGGGFSACTSPKDYSSLSDGSHTFQVRAINGVGIPDPTPDSFTWTIDTAAPNTTIGSKPSNPSNSGSTSFSFTGDADVASFECQLDGGGFSACTSPKDYSGLSDGSHTFQVRAIDGAGNTDPTPDSFTWTIDTTAPNTTIGSKPSNPSNSGSASFSFTGDADVASFECKLDAANFSACTSPKDYSDLSDGSHTFQVRAIDGAGNTDPTPDSFTWTIDTAAPNTTIGSKPSNPSNSGSASFSFTGDADVASFECKLDAATFSACTSPKDYSDLSDGSHTFQVRAIDGAGNTDPTPDSFTWTIDTAAPNTTIGSKPSNPSNSGSASFSFTGDADVASFECKLDAATFSACTSPKDYSDLSDGSHTFQVRAIDGAGNTDPTPDSFTWTIDTAAPNTTIDGKPADPSAINSASFSFSGTDADTGVASFQCQLDGGGFSACTSPKSYSGLSNGSHTFQVRAIDGAGNTDPTPDSFTWAVETSPPDTTIDSKPSNPSTSGSASFGFSGTDGGSGVASFQCQLDGGGFSACTSAKSYSGLSDGSHIFEVRAIGGDTNADPTPASFTWTIDTAPPDTTIDGKPADPSGSGSASFSFGGTDAGTGVASFQCKLDAGSFAACTSPSDYSGLSDGNHTFQVRAIDGLGNPDPTPDSFTWTIDTAAPNTTIGGNPSDPTNSGSASFSFSGTDAGTGVASFECQLDGGGFSACTSAKDYSGLLEGIHTFEVRAIDEAGNTDPTPDSFTWTIDNTAPDTTIGDHPSDPSGSSSASFSFTGDAGVASFECELDGGGFSACTSTKDYSGLSDGGHTFLVRAIDEAGNTDPTPDSFSWTIDSTEPDTTIDGKPSNPSGSGSASFSFSGIDGGSGVASFECKLDGGGFSACTSPKDYPGLSDGSHTFQVRAIGSDANADPTPASFTWTIDTLPPAVTIDQASGQADPASVSPVHFGVVFAEPVTGFADGDVALSGTAGATTALVTGSGTTYDVAVSGMTGDGTVIASIPAGAAVDAGGNGNTASTSIDNTVTLSSISPPIPNSAPTMTIADGHCSSATKASGTLALTLFDADGDTVSLALASNSNTALLPNGSVALGGSGSDRTLSATGAAKKGGTAIITLELSDGKVTVPVTITLKIGRGKADVLNGTSGTDMIFGLAGGDTIGGLGGDDLLCGGKGGDTLSGGDGRDILDSSSGNDSLRGGNGNDSLRGSGGNDSLRGAAGDDSLSGGKGNDSLRGSGGNDSLSGGKGKDKLRGSSGNDSLTGGAGGDNFSGGSGTDVATDFSAAQGDTQDGTIP